MTREQFLDKLGAIAINSDLATYCNEQRGRTDDDDAEAAIERKANAYYARRSDLIREVMDWWDATFPETAP